MSRVTPKPAKTSIPLRESVYKLGKPERVDREKGVIFGVKVLGLESVNGRRYTREAVERAAKLYEGLAVNVDHPREADDPRSAHDRFGWLENIRVRDDGLYGDLHLLDPEDPLARKLLKAAEERPDVYGLSHNAQGDGHRDDSGTFIVEAITEARSVDLVAEPATTKGLFEGRTEKGKPMKVKAFLEAALKVKSAPKKSVKALKKLVEGDMPDMDMDEDDALPTEDATAGDWRAALAAVVGQLASSEDADAHDMAARIMKLLKPEAAVTEEDEEEKVEEEEDEEIKEGEDEEDEEDKKPKESRRSRKRKPDNGTRELREELAVRDLIEDAGIKFTKPESRKAFIKSLIPLTESERKSLVEERKSLPEEDARRSAPRNPGPSRQSGNSGNAQTKFPTSYEEAKRLIS